MSLAISASPLRSDAYASPAAEPRTADATANEPANDPTKKATGDSYEPSGDTPAQKTPGSKQQLSADDLRMIVGLQARDREVRAHEAAHQAAGGGAVGGASYTYQQGPDGRQYAVGGEVPVDMSTTGGKPAEVIAKMERVRAAALAPADPSGQDMSVAASAAAIEAQARQELQAATIKSSKDSAASTDGDRSKQRAIGAYQSATPSAGSDTEANTETIDQTA